MKNREKSRKRRTIEKKRHKSGRFFHFCPSTGRADYTTAIGGGWERRNPLEVNFIKCM